MTALVLALLAAAVGAASGYAIATGLARAGRARGAAICEPAPPQPAFPEPVDVMAPEYPVAPLPEDEPRGDVPQRPGPGGLRAAWLMQTGEALPIPKERRAVPADDPPPPPVERQADACPTLAELEQRLAAVRARLEREAQGRTRPAAPVPANDLEPPLLDEAAQEAVASALAQLEAVTTER